MIHSRRAKGLPTRHKTDRFAGRRFMILAAVIPTAVFYGLWVGIPLVHSLVMSFYDWNPLSTSTRFIGLANYGEAFFRDPLFWLTVRNTLYYTAVTVPVTTLLALILGLLIISLPRFAGFYRVVYFIPVVTSIVATSIMWKWLYQPRFGLINQIIRLIFVDTLGLSINPWVGWLTSKTLAMPSIMAMSIWKGLGFSLVLFLAGLTSLPRVYYEAAQIDGAGRWQLLRHITLPLLKPTTIFVLITGVIGGLQEFTPMYIMTQGGPVNTTKTIVFELFEKAFRSYRFGYASALSFILFFLILIFTLVQWRFIRTQWEY